MVKKFSEETQIKMNWNLRRKCFYELKFYQVVRLKKKEITLVALRFRKSKVLRKYFPPIKNLRAVN